MRFTLRVGWLFKESDESTGKRIEFVVLLNAFEGESETDKSVWLGNGCIRTVSIGEDGESVA